jgi:hypothetical protein
MNPLLLIVILLLLFGGGGFYMGVPVYGGPLPSIVADIQASHGLERWAEISAEINNRGSTPVSVSHVMPVTPKGSFWVASGKVRGSIGEPSRTP